MNFISDFVSTRNSVVKARTIILIVQIIQVILFLVSVNSATDIGPTLDDSWIHYQFARNIAEHGEVSFNTGEWSVGTTSLLWDIILASGIYVGFPIIEFSFFLGTALYLILAQLIITIFKSFWENNWNTLFAVLLIIINGNMAWFALSGMETILVLVLGLWWIIEFSNKKYVLTGIITGLLILARIEGLLFVFIGTFFILRNHGFKNGTKHVLTFVIIIIPFILPTILLNLKVAGEIYPTTMAGKKWLYSMDSSFINTSPKRLITFYSGWIKTLYNSLWFPELADKPYSLIFNIVRIILPHKTAGRGMGMEIGAPPILLQLVVIVIGIFMLVILLMGAGCTLRRMQRNYFAGIEFKKWEYLVIYFLCINVLYSLVLPYRGHGGRYQAVNFILIGFFTIAGIRNSKIIENIFPRKIISLILFLTMALYIKSVPAWIDIYTESVKHINEVHCATGKWLRKNLPSDTVIGVFDVGAVKYFSGLQVVDIAGLTDRSALAYVLDGNILELLRERQAEYLVMVEEYPNGRSDILQEKTNFNHETYERLGIKKELGKIVNLEPVKKFSFPANEHKLTWNVLRTHSPILAIYKIHWLNIENKNL